MEPAKVPKIIGEPVPQREAPQQLAREGAVPARAEAHAEQPIRQPSAQQQLRDSLVGFVARQYCVVDRLEVLDLTDKRQVIGVVVKTDRAIEVGNARNAQAAAEEYIRLGADLNAAIQ